MPDKPSGEFIPVYLSSDTHRRLLIAASETDRHIEELAEAAVEQEALNYAKARNLDPL